MFLSQESLSNPEKFPNSKNSKLDSEKIDYIYRTLRSERRWRIFKLIIKLSLLGAVVYGYYYVSLPANTEIRKKFMDGIQTRVTELVVPMVTNIVGGMTKNMPVPQSGTSSPIKITPEMIKAVQDAMRKK